MTPSPPEPTSAVATTPAVTTAESATEIGTEIADQIAIEQAHVDAVYAELESASERAALVAADGMARGRTDRTGDIRDEEMSGLFERDALVFNAARRQAALDTQYEGLVFGRLDLAHPAPGATIDSDDHDWWRGLEREIRYIGRLGVRDGNYEPLVIDWRAPAASAFYRATPVQPHGVIRRRVLRSQGTTVVGIEDDLMVADAPDDLVVVGDGALLAALTRTRGARMRDIVATIQRHQDEAIRAPSRGVTEITGGPGTGKTVVALHRAAYLLYAERRRFEGGGILVVGPSTAYTAYIERVLPSLGEDSVTLRSLGDLVDAVSATRHDRPEVAAVKGSLRVRRLLERAARAAVPGGPQSFRAFVGGQAINLGAEALANVRGRALSKHRRNAAVDAARSHLAEAAWASHRVGLRADFMEAFETSMAVDEFMAAWWPQLDPREVLLWLADTDLAYRLGRGSLTDDESAAIAESMRDGLALGTWSVADVALIDDLAERLGPVRHDVGEERGFYEIDELDSLSANEFRELGQRSVAAPTDGPSRGLEPRDTLLRGVIGEPAEYAHVLVDEAQDLSPMQWRMLGRVAEWASWTVVGDAAQASWGDASEAARARDAAFGTSPRRHFHMDTNYRNAREIFDYARDVILPVMPTADIPNAVRETGIQPAERTFTDVVAAAREAVAELSIEVAGSIAVITPLRHADRLAGLDGTHDGRVQVIDPLSTKGLEYDATVVIDPDAIVSESPGGARVLYVVLTRAAHRMTVLRPD
ncbi:HelD family protein [Nostocoides jenkinsii]|uniref:HelD family protein n=1 Tax=Nostocoides jenkinsii TaxID=330834 RepID=UPI0009FC88B7